MTVGVLKVTRISAPKGLLRGFRNPCAGGAGLTHNGIHFALASDVVAEGELGGAPTTLCCHTRVKGEVRTGEKRKPCCRSKTAMAPCSNSVPIMPSLLKPSPSR